MTLKIIGAILILIGCGGFGAMVVRNHRAEVTSLEQLISALDYMECQMMYQLTQLPELCQNISCTTRGVVKKVFNLVSANLENHDSPDVESCMFLAMENVKDIPKITEKYLIELGKSMGKFDLDGQQKAIQTVKNGCQRAMQAITNNQDARLRSYQTLGLCAGVALAILFI